MKLIFVRHAEPDYAADSLTEKGWREAKLLSRRLVRLKNVEAWYGSPLGRAQATASRTLEKLGVAAETLPWLQEFRGRTPDPETGVERICWDYRPRLWKVRPLLHDSARWMEDAWMQGTNVYDIWRETAEGLDSVLARHGFHRDGPVYRCEENRKNCLVFFCHFGIAAVMTSYLMGLPPFELLQNFCMQPSSVTTLVTEERTRSEVIFRCTQWGDVSHLWAADEPCSTAGLFAEVYDGADNTIPRVEAP